MLAYWDIISVMYVIVMPSQPKVSYWLLKNRQLRKLLSRLAEKNKELYEFERMLEGS